MAVSPDGSETVNSSDALSADDWMPLPVDVHGRPFSIHVRPRRHCSRWKFTRLSFDVRGASKFRVRIGEVYVTNWVSDSYTAYVDTLLFTFCVSRRRRKIYCGHARLSVFPRPYAHTTARTRM